MEAAAHLVEERCALRDAGAPIERIHHDLELQYAIPANVFEEAAAELAEKRGFVFDQNQPRHLWLSKDYAAEQKIAVCVARLCGQPPGAPKRRPPKTITVFPKRRGSFGRLRGSLPA